MTQHRQVGQMGQGIPSIGMYGDNQQLQNTRSNLRNVPEITKEVSSDANLSEDDYHDPRRGRIQQQQQHYQVSPLYPFLLLLLPLRKRLANVWNLALF